MDKTYFKVFGSQEHLWKANTCQDAGGVLDTIWLFWCWLSGRFLQDEGNHEKGRLLLNTMLYLYLCGWCVKEANFIPQQGDNQSTNPKYTSKLCSNYFGKTFLQM